MDSLGDRIQANRERCGWSISDLSRQSGVSRAHLYMVERGEAQLGLQHGANLARALGITLDAMFYGDDTTGLEPDEYLLIRNWREKNWSDLLGMIATKMVGEGG
jgi:transcriptional regulator with XRE-family HTH domain